MGLAISSFASDDVQVQGNKCQGKCENGMPTISNVEILSYGSNPSKLEWGSSCA